MVVRRVVITVALGIGLSASLVFAHSTGRESRVPAQCQRLPTPERSTCLVCVTRPLRHHYHPDYPPGARCRPDNGKP